MCTVVRAFWYLVILDARRVYRSFLLLLLCLKIQICKNLAHVHNGLLASIFRQVLGLVMACSESGLSKGYIITESTTKTIVEDGVEIWVVPITVFLLGFAEQV